MKKIHSIILIIFSIIFGFTSLTISKYFALTNNYHQLFNGYENNKIYYHLFLEDWHFSISEDYHHFGRDPNIDQQVANIDGVNNVYPFIALSFSNYFIDGKGEYNEVNIEVNGASIQEEFSQSLRLHIIPYYPEDNLDSSMEKCFVSPNFYNILKSDFNIDCLNQEMTIKNVRIPVDQNNDHEVYFGADGKAQIKAYPYSVEFSQTEMNFTISGIYDTFYRSDIYDTKNAIIVPYQYLNDYYAYSGTNVVFAESLENNRNIMNKIQEIDNRIALESPYILDKDEFSSLKASEGPKMFLAIVFLLLEISVHLIYINKNRNVNNEFNGKYWFYLFGGSVLFVVIKIFNLNKYNRYKYYILSVKQTMMTYSLLIIFIGIILMILSNYVINKLFRKQK